MWIINSIVGIIVNGMLLPFRGMPPLVGLTVFSLISGVGALYVYKWTSDQDRLAEVKRKIHAGIFEIRLFNDDMRAILAAQRDILQDARADPTCDLFCVRRICRGTSA